MSANEISGDIEVHEVQFQAAKRGTTQNQEEQKHVALPRTHQTEFQSVQGI